MSPIYIYLQISSQIIRSTICFYVCRWHTRQHTPSTLNIYLLWMPVIKKLFLVSEWRMPMSPNFYHTKTNKLMYSGN